MTANIKHQTHVWGSLWDDPSPSHCLTAPMGEAVWGRFASLPQPSEPWETMVMRNRYCLCHQVWGGLSHRWQHSLSQVNYALFFLILHVVGEADSKNWPTCAFPGEEGRADFCFKPSGHAKGGFTRQPWLGKIISGWASINREVIWFPFFYFCVYMEFSLIMLKDNEWTLDQQQNDAYSNSPEQTSILLTNNKTSS